MPTAKGAPTQDEFIRGLLARRGDALALLKEAREAGNLKDAKAYEKAAKDFEKLLARQGVKFDS